MSDDFVTRLGLQLQEAAERDMRRSAPSRALRGQRWLTPALAGAIALAVVVAAVAAATLWLRGDATPLPAQPRVVATLHVTDNPVQIVDAFGSIWIADHIAGRILRLDPATGAVQATIPVRTGNWLWITQVRDQLWASVDELPLVQRIDPDTNRVVARTPVRTPDGRPFRVGYVWAAGDNVWAMSGIGAVRLDPASGRGLVVADAPRAVRGFELGDDTLWAPGLGDTLHRIDPRTGARRGSIPSGLPGTERIAAMEGALYATRGAELARLDPATGAAVWTHTFAGRLNGITQSRDLGWAHVTIDGQGDRLVSFDAATGRERSTTRLETIGLSWLAARGDRVWMNTPGGATVVVGQATR
ncbi:MAG: PQQ-binding-like beta-propeller repeat protein [Solirubrobacteraceae bacterium]